QDTWSGAGDRLRLTLGGRFDRLDVTSDTRVMPRASLDWRAAGHTRLLAAFGTYTQFPDFQQLFGANGRADRQAERARQALAGVEHAGGASTSLRLEAYDQGLAGFISNPDADWRRAGSHIVGAQADALLRNALSGRSRGLEVVLERRRATGLSGWV